MSLRVAILISGSGSNMVALAKSMTGDHPARPCLVLSNRPDAGGLAKAAEMSIPTETLDHRGFDTRADFDAALDAILRRYNPDLICLAGFMRVLTPEFVSGWQGKMLNIHPSLLPKYRGLHTHARALEARDPVHGCTVHEVTADLDDGPILGQARLDVIAGDTPDTLATRLLPLEHRLYPIVLRRVADGDRTPVFLDGDAPFSSVDA